MNRTGWLLAAAVAAVACGGSLPGVHSSECPAGQTTLDGTCVSQRIADYVACIRATGATIASNSAKELSAKAGVAGLTASTAAEVQDKLEKSYEKVSDANVLEIIHDCRTKTDRESERAVANSDVEHRPATIDSTGPGTACRQWNVTGQWTTQQSNGFTVTMNLSQRGQSVTGQAIENTGRMGAGTLKGELISNQLSLFISWQANPGAVGHYLAVVAKGFLSGTATDNRGAVALWNGVGPTACGE